MADSNRTTSDRLRYTWIHLYSETDDRRVLSSKVYVDLYSAFRLDMEHTVSPANYTMPAFTPQPQSITVLWLVLISPSHGG